MQATGGNPEAAAHAGIATGKARLTVLALMGAIAGLAGIIRLGAQGSVAAADGNGVALLAIAAALLGGTRLSGGHGSAIGALLVQVVLGGMALLGIDAAWISSAIGALGVGAGGGPARQDLARPPRRAPAGRPARLGPTSQISRN
ncbi:ABC transporter permease subunit [Mesorhizobium sp. ORM8.1]